MVSASKYVALGAAVERASLELLDELVVGDDPGRERTAALRWRALLALGAVVVALGTIFAPAATLGGRE